MTEYEIDSRKVVYDNQLEAIIIYSSNFETGCMEIDIKESYNQQKILEDILRNKGVI